MKKILAVIMAGLIILVGCSSKQPDYKITPTQAIEILETGENIILYLGSRECSACQALAPTFEEVANEYPNKLYYIEILDAQANHTEDYAKLLEEYTGKLSSTPTIFAINNKEVVDKHVGLMKYTELENMMSRNNIK
ncbi:MAG: thioredoxin family protein [Erysipelothrix sp.]|nr:thioredoxin family protein [Erysipelothrix sp.]